MFGEASSPKGHGMTRQEQIWSKPMQKAKDLANTHAPILRSVGVSSWAKSIYEALEAQKELKARG